MKPSLKPEWIELADQDNSAFPQKASKALPVMALVVTASILGIGSSFAQSADESSANAVEITTPAVQNSQSVETSPVAASNIAFTAQGTAAVSPTAPKIKNPGIGTMPTGGGDDGDESEDEGVDDDFEGADD